MRTAGSDVYVANDGDANQLWINERGTGVFRDEALLAGVAVSRTGQAQGSMGIDLADIDRDGDEDLFVTNLDNESNTFYLNTGKGLFEDRTSEFGLFRLGFTGFTAFLDYDNDGWLDLMVVNGAVRHLPVQVRTGDPYPSNSAISCCATSRDDGLSIDYHWRGLYSIASRWLAGCQSVISTTTATPTR